MCTFFITGTSGSGKSSLINHLQNRLPQAHFEVYDFDEVGVPQNADQTWRLATTKYWLTQARENWLAKKCTIICGVSVPSEVLSLAQEHNFSIHFGFIRIDNKTIQERLSAKGWNEQLIQNNINWAYFLEKEVQNQPNHCIVEGHSDPEKIADKFVVWINACYCNLVC